jgi:hypothetical protein
MKTQVAWLDNEMRRENIIRGMITRLKNGYWPCKSPLGYTSQLKDEIRINVPDENARFIKLAFEKRAFEQMPLNEIADLLTTMGFQTNNKKQSQILMNPFYCGIIQHGLTGKDNLIHGKHEPLISPKVFYLFHEKKHQSKKIWVQLPLKEFVCCGCCGGRMSGIIYIKAKHSQDNYRGLAFTSTVKLSGLRNEEPVVGFLMIS